MHQRVLAHRNFRLLIFAQVVDTAGNSVLRVVLAFAVLDVSGAIADVGLVVGSEAIGAVMFVLVGGVVADRWPRPVVLVWSNVLAGLIQAVLAWSIIAGWATIPLMVALGFGAGAAAAMSHPASVSMIPETVPAALLQKANATSSSARSIVRIAALAGGAGLAAIIGPGWGIALNAVSFGFAALMYQLIDARPVDKPASSVLSDLKGGWSEFVRNRWAWVVVLSFMVMNAAFSGTILVLGPVVADRTFGRVRWGWVLAAESIGLVVIALALTRSKHVARLSTGMVGAALTAPFMASLSGTPIIGWVVAAGAVSGLGIGYFDVAWNLSLQSNIPPNTLSRVYSIDALGSMLAIPIGQMTAGPMAAAFGMSRTILALSLTVAVVALSTLAVPQVRNLRPSIA